MNGFMRLDKRLLDKTLLENLYIFEDKSQYQLSEIFGCSQQSVTFYLKKAGIPGKSKGRSGDKNPFWGKCHTEETKEKISKANKGKTPGKGIKHPSMMGDKNPAKRPEVRALISKRVKETHWDNSGSKHPNFGVRKFGKENPAYIHGNSCRPYPHEFSKELKRKILERDSFTCQKCFVYPNNDLTIHHIDYNKYHNDKINLITLCRRCNSKVNANRKYWQSHFSKLAIFSEEKLCQKELF